jgi:hypothetical protein
MKTERPLNGDVPFCKMESNDSRRWTVKSRETFDSVFIARCA